MGQPRTLQLPHLTDELGHVHPLGPALGGAGARALGEVTAGRETGADYSAPRRIVSDPEILLGKPTVKGTRISVELILGWLAESWTFEQLLEAFRPA